MMKIVAAVLSALAIFTTTQVVGSPNVSVMADNHWCC